MLILKIKGQQTTAFGLNPAHKRALLSSRFACTRITSSHTGGWAQPCLNNFLTCLLFFSYLTIFSHWLLWFLVLPTEKYKPDSLSSNLLDTILSFSWGSQGLKDINWQMLIFTRLGHSWNIFWWFTWDIWNNKKWYCTCDQRQQTWGGCCDALLWCPASGLKDCFPSFWECWQQTTHSCQPSLGTASGTNTCLNSRSCLLSGHPHAMTDQHKGIETQPPTSTCGIL